MTMDISPPNLYKACPAARSGQWSGELSCERRAATTSDSSGHKGKQAAAVGLSCQLAVGEN